MHHACCMAKPGRTFLRHMLDLLKLPSATEPHHHIQLNKICFQSGLRRWANMEWNLDDITMVIITSNVSGLGALHFGGNYQRPDSCKTAGHHCERTTPHCVGSGHVGPQVVVQCLCDNTAMVAIIKLGSSTCEEVMHLKNYCQCSSKLLLTTIVWLNSNSRNL